MSTSYCFAVDRVDGPYAVVVMDTGQTYHIPRGSLREGQVYCWNGKRWTRNKREERRRLDEARRQLEQLQRTDSGGDITL